MKVVGRKNGLRGGTHRRGVCTRLLGTARLNSRSVHHQKGTVAEFGSVL